MLAINWIWSMFASLKGGDNGLGVPNPIGKDGMDVKGCACVEVGVNARSEAGVFEGIGVDSNVESNNLPGSQPDIIKFDASKHTIFRGMSAENRLLAIIVLPYFV
jgi:hypothetical protein